MNIIVSNVCRGCLWNKNAGIHLFSAVDDEFDLPLSDEFREITSISIEEDDELPQFICYKCYDQLKIAYKFRKTCRNSEDRLRGAAGEDQKILLLKPDYNSDPDTYNNTNNGDDDDHYSLDLDVKPSVHLMTKNLEENNKPTQSQKCPVVKKIEENVDDKSLIMKIEFEPEEIVEPIATKTKKPKLPPPLRARPQRPPPTPHSVQTSQFDADIDIETQIHVTEIQKEPIVYAALAQNDYFGFDLDGGLINLEEIDMIVEPDSSNETSSQENPVLPKLFGDFVTKTPIAPSATFDSGQPIWPLGQSGENGDGKMFTMDVNDMIIDERETQTDIESVDMYYCSTCGSVFISEQGLREHVACDHGEQIGGQSVEHQQQHLQHHITKEATPPPPFRVKRKWEENNVSNDDEDEEDVDDCVANAYDSSIAVGNDDDDGCTENETPMCETDGGRQFSCRKCESVSFSVQDYREFHELKCAGKNNECFLCWFCGLDFKTFGALHVHIQDGHRMQLCEKPHQCEICYKHFDQSMNLERHLHMKHFRVSAKMKLPGRWTSREYKCDICDKICYTKSNLDVHKSTHEERKYKCPHCPMRYSREIVLNQHLQLHDDTIPKYNCTTCHLFFLNPERLVEHNRKVHCLDRETFKCDKCNRDILVTNREKHARTHDENYVSPSRVRTPDVLVRYECNYCGRQFKQSSTLHTHLALHTGKTVECTLCKAKFSRQSFLNVHMRTHTGDLPYKCDLCELKFNQKSALESHAANQHGVGQIPCEYCQKIFNDILNLKTHMKTIHKVELKRRNRCFKCDINFETTEEYNRHSHMHVTENSPKFIKLISSLTEEEMPRSVDESSIGGDPTLDAITTTTPTSTDDGNESEPMQMIEADDFLI